MNEIQIMKRIKQHLNVVQFLEVFESGSKVYVVMEYASNGDLLKYLKNKKKLTQNEIKKILI